jgi:DNA modification methylase
VNYGEKIEEANPMGYRVRQIQNDDLSPEKLEELVRSALKNASEYSLPGAAIYAACPAGTLLPALIGAFAGSGFEFRWGLVWVKDQIVLSRADYHFKHENILYGWKPDAAHYFTPDITQASVFDYPRPKKSDEHPTMKPIELIQHMLRNSSEKYDIVLDVFGGSGSTMLACQNEGRYCRMIELEPKYCAVTLERMSQAFPDLTIERIQNENSTP